jgi:hypothetical protein
MEPDSGGLRGIQASGTLTIRRQGGLTPDQDVDGGRPVAVATIVESTCRQEYRDGHDNGGRIPSLIPMADRLAGAGRDCSAAP